MSNALRILPLMLNRQTFAGVPALLTILAFTACTSLFLLVTGGMWAFAHWEPAGLEAEYILLYRVLAGLATALLIIPAVSLGTAAAKLSARHHDQRLATLSLLGADAAAIRIIATAEPLALAAVGVIAGIGGYYLLAMPVSTIPFQGAGLGYQALILPAWLTAAVLIALLGICALASLIGLRRLSVSPLGVRARSLRRRFPSLQIGTLIAVLAGIFIGVFLLYASNLSSTVLAVIGLAVVVGAFLAIDLIGVLVIRLLAHLRARRTRRTHTLVSARLVSDSPRQYWRRVSGIAMTAFIGVFAGTGVALISSERSGLGGVEALLADDMVTGLLLTLGISFTLIAVSAVLNQAVDIYDRRDIYATLGATGMPTPMMHRINVSAVMMPVVWVSLIAGGLAMLMVLPFAGYAIVFSTFTMLTMLASVVIGALLVRAGLGLTRPLTARLAHAPA